MESETISEASADGNTELTLDDMADAVAEVKAKKLEVRAEALVNAMDKSLAQGKFETLGNTRPKETAHGLDDALADTSAEVEPETLS